MPPRRKPPFRIVSRPAIPVGMRESVGVPSALDWLIFVLVVQWQDRCETCAISQRTVEFDPPSHFGNQAPDHPKPDAETAAVGAGHHLLERRKDARLVLGRDAGAAVPN